MQSIPNMKTIIMIVHSFKIGVAKKSQLTHQAFHNDYQQAKQNELGFINTTHKRVTKLRDETGA